MLAGLTTELDRLSPRFELQPSQIEILSTPSDFYETLKVSLFMRPSPWPVASSTVMISRELSPNKGVRVLATMMAMILHLCNSPIKTKANYTEVG